MTQPLTAQQLDEIETRWAPVPRNDRPSLTVTGSSSPGVLLTALAHAPEDVAALLDEVRRLTAELAQAQENYQAYRIGAEGAKQILATRVAALEATSVPDETEYAVRMPGSNDVWPRREFRNGHWERVLASGGQLLERVIRRGPWVEAPNQCPGFEGNPVAPDLCAGCHEPRDTHPTP